MRGFLGILHLLFLAHSFSWGQLSLGPRHSRLIVPARMEFNVMTPELIVDTLIMDNNSSLVFTQPYNRVVIRYAIIGKKCQWVGKGAAAGNFEGSSIRGASMDIEIHFRKLGRLTIDVRGGLGFTGSPGEPGTAGMSGGVGTANGGAGGDGGRGGDGGDGGNVTFRYKSLGEPVKFSKAKRNAVLILLEGGSGGPGGPGGSGGAGRMPTSRQYQGPTGTVVEWNGQRGLPGPQGNHGDAGDKGTTGRLAIVQIKQ